MRIKKITKTDPIERLAVSVRKSTAELVEGYRQHYEATYGDPITLSLLVEEILRSFIEGDKDYQKTLQSEGAAKAAPAEPILPR